MKKHFNRLVVIMLSISMILGMTPMTAKAAKTTKSTETSNAQFTIESEKKSDSNLKPFTSTEDLIADMQKEAAADPQKKKEEEELQKQQEALAMVIQEKSGATLNQVEDEIEKGIFTNRDTKKIDVSKYKLSKEEMSSIVTLILKQDHATTLVKVDIDVDTDGNATTLKAEIDPAFAMGLDELDTIKGVGKIPGTVTQESSSESKSTKLMARAVHEHTYGEPTFDWIRKSDGTYSCRAIFICTDCTEMADPVECTVTSKEDGDQILYTASCEFEGKTYTAELDATTKQLYADWAAMCEFYSQSYEYFGIPTEYWMSKDTESTPMGAIKILAGYNVDAPVPAANMDQIIGGLTQAFQAYVQYYGDALLAARDKAMAQLDDSMTDLQKCLVLHDYIAQHAVFDMASLTDQQNQGKSPDAIEMTPFGALLAGQVKGINGCVCIAYTAAYTYLIQNAFPEVYRDNNNKLKSYADVKDDAIVDFTMIKYDCDTAEVGVAGADSGFSGRFTQPHFFNAVKVDGQWYFVDVCYDDIESETMSQYRVETDGNCRHMYFLCSYDTLSGWYDGYYQFIDTLHENDSKKPCNSKKYEDAWFTGVNCPIYHDKNYWYFVDTQMSYSQMSGMEGNFGNMDSSQLDQMMSMFDSPDYADRMKARLRTASDESEDDGENVLFDYGYGKVTNLKTGEQVTDDTMAAECNEDIAANKVYPELVHTLALANNTLYFNLGNKIYMYDLKTGQITQLKAYNDVYAKTDGSEFTGSSYYMASADAENIDFHVVNHPVAALCIKDDGIMYVSVATNYSQSKESNYKVESVNFNRRYMRFGGNNKQTNDNKEFMWCANIKDNMNMNDIQTYLSGSGKMQEVTVAPWCGVQGYTEQRDTVTGCSSGAEKTKLTDAAEHHYIYSDTEGCYICSRCYSVLKKEDAESNGIKTGHTYTKNPKFTWTEGKDGEYDCTADFVCTYGDDTQAVPCKVTSKKTGSCTEKGTAVYTADCTFAGNEYSDTKTVEIPPQGHTYGEPSYNWGKQDDGSYLCTATFTCTRCNDIQRAVCSKINIIEQKDATCTEAGYITFRATCTFEGKEYYNDKTDELPIIKHSYGEPSFNWEKQEDGTYQCTAVFTCEKCNNIEKVLCKVTEGEKKDATCTEDGTMEYKATCIFDGKDYTAEPKIDVIHAIGHSYGKPEFTWVKEEGGYSCSAKVTCSKDGEVKNLPCTISAERTVPTCTQKGAVVYTVLCTLDEVDYTETKTEEIAALGHNLVYKDNGDATQTVTCTRCDYSVVEKTVAAQPMNIKASSSDYNSIKVSWNAVKGADTYAVYEKTSSGWKRIATSKDTSYNVKGRVTGQNYMFTVSSLNTVGESTYDAKGVTAKSVLSVPKVTAASAGYNSVKISWNKINGASGYYVYRWNGKDWSKIKTITSGKTCSYTNTKLTTGTSYKYMVVAYRSVNDKKVRSGYNTKGVTAKPVPSAPKVYSASAGTKKITVKWKKVDGASGYYVYRKDGSKLTKLKKITNKSTTSWTNTGLKKGKKYTYVVRAYTMVKSNKVNGTYSKSITGKAK